MEKIGVICVIFRVPVGVYISCTATCYNQEGHHFQPLHQHSLLQSTQLKWVPEGLAIFCSCINTNWGEHLGSVAILVCCCILKSTIFF